MSKNTGLTVYIESYRSLMAGCMFFFFMMSAGCTLAQNDPGNYSLELGEVKDGQVPAGWKASSTNPDGPIAQWAAGVDASTATHEKILSIVRIQDTSSSVFNLIWSRQLVFKDGDLSVRMRANSGKVDQGGGIIWRVLDDNNYYVARYNPLENNFRLYYVEDGQRNQLASAEQLTAKAGVWVQLRIKHQGRHIQGWFNNTLAWEVNDAHLPKAGGIGLWSKADAASSFADLEMRTKPLNASKKLANE